MTLSRQVTNARVAFYSLLVFLGSHRFVEAFSTGCTLPTSSTRSFSRVRGKVACNAAKEGFSDNLDNIKRVYCISDLHTDSAINMRWLEAKCVPSNDNSIPGKGDLLVVAGDIAHELETLRQTLKVLQRLECDIFFIPGNHEAWLTSHCRSYLDNSIQKLDAVCETCQRMGVYTDHLLVGKASSHPLWIVPIQGWYDGSLSIKGCESFCEGFEFWPWTDFSRCTWPTEFPLNDLNSENARIPKGLTEHFLHCNEPGIKAIRSSLLQQGADGASDMRVAGVMSVSHFLTNQQCLPDWKDVDSPVFLRDEWLKHGAPQISAKFAKVAGSNLLDAQIRSIVPPGINTRHLHVFGHSHRPKDLDFQGIRYIHNPLGKPREREMYMVSPEVSFQLLWDTSEGEVPGEKIVRYWEEQGGGKEALWERLKKRREYSKRVKASAMRTSAEGGTSQRR